MNDQKKSYSKPEVKDLGSVAELTQAGKSQPIVNDVKGGSNMRGQ